MIRSKKLRTTLGVLAVVALAVVARLYTVRPQPSSDQTGLTDLTSMDSLRAQFNRDAGRPRLLMLVSPT